MIAHSDVVYVIDGHGVIKTEFNADPGAGTASSVSSFAVELSGAAENVMNHGRHPQPAILGIGGLLLAGCLVAGCGSTSAASTRRRPFAAPPPLATSLRTASVPGWTIVEMGGLAAEETNFGSCSRGRRARGVRLATRSGWADNGGLVVAGPAASRC